MNKNHYFALLSYAWDLASEDRKMDCYNRYAIANNRPQVHKNTPSEIDRQFPSAYDMAEAIDDGHYRLRDEFFFIDECNCLLSSDSVDSFVELDEVSDYYWLEDVDIIDGELPWNY